MFEGSTITQYDYTKPVGHPERRTGYYSIVRPASAPREGFGGYLRDGELEAGAVRVRVLTKPTDNAEMSSRDRDEMGWYYNDFGDTMRAVLGRLPHGRFFAGWTMGEGMATSFDAEVYDDERKAWRAAMHLTEQAAEKEREYQEEENAKMRAEEEEAEATALQAEAAAFAEDLRLAARIVRQHDSATLADRLDAHADALGA